MNGGRQRRLPKGEHSGVHGTTRRQKVETRRRTGGGTYAARQRIRPKFDDGGGWTGLRLGRAWAVRLPRREIAYVALVRALGLAGSTLLGSVDARAGTRHSGVPLLQSGSTRRPGQPGASVRGDLIATPGA